MATHDRAAIDLRAARRRTPESCSTRSSPKRNAPRAVSPCCTRSTALIALDDADLLKALGDAHPQVRRHAIRLSEPRLDKSAALREKVLSLVADADPVVQFQLALSLGECRDNAATAALASILIRSAANRDIADAALTSIVDRAGVVMALVLGDDKWAASPSGESVLGAIVGQIVRQRRGEDLDALVSLLQKSDGRSHAASQAALLKALSRLAGRCARWRRPAATDRCFASCGSRRPKS